MQTNFSAEQLADSGVAEAEKSCANASTAVSEPPPARHNVTLGNELDSPRGRIYLIKDMLENDRPADDKVVKHIDRCLSCLACMTTCPSGVHYMHLVDHARAHIEKTYRRPLLNRLNRAALALVLPYPARFCASVSLARPLAPTLSPPAMSAASPRSGTGPRCRSSIPSNCSTGCMAAPSRAN